MAKPAKKPATYVAKGVTALGRSKTYKRCAHGDGWEHRRRCAWASGSPFGQPPLRLVQMVAA